MRPLFLSHGSPMIAVEQTGYTSFLREYGRTLKPKAVVMFTAHWESDVLTVSSTDGEYKTIYDFGGFPPELYRVKYPAKGSVEAASELANMLESGGIPVRKDTSRGLDHGVWTLLVHLFPDADIPVVQASVNPFLPMEEQYGIGQAVRSLGEQGVLVIGSGATVHNFRTMNMSATEADPRAVEFDDWLIEHMRSNDLESLFHVMEKAPHASMAVPRAEHFVPLYIAMGSGKAEDVKVLHQSYEFGSLSYLALQF